MKNSDILSVLNSHREITEVELGVQKDCQAFYDKFSESCYNNPKIEKLGLDYEIRVALLRLRESGDSLEFVNSKGKFLKRFAGFYKKLNGKVLSDTVMGIIGDILQQYVNGTNNTTFWIDFTDKITWKDGEFGKSGSCWWGMYAASIPTFEHGGGWTVRFYDKNKKGIGRTFLVPHDGLLLGFNSYGVERPAVSKVLKQVFKDKGFELHYKTCDIVNERSNDIPYINGGTGFQLFDCDESELYTEYNLDMKIIGGCRCSNCNSVGNEEDFYEENGNWYCEDCHDEMFSVCDKCGETERSHDVVEIDHPRFSIVCESCAGKLGFKQCSECDEWKSDCILSESDNLFCQDCNECFNCENCNIWIEDATECRTCAELEEVENSEDLEIGTTNITVKGGRKIPNTTVITSIKNPGLMVIKDGNCFGVFCENTNSFIQSDIPFLKTSITAMEMWGALGKWSEVTEENLKEKVDVSQAQSVTRYIRGLN